MAEVQREDNEIRLDEMEFLDGSNELIDPSDTLNEEPVRNFQIPIKFFCSLLNALLLF